jgi:hypothetical protein
MNHAHLWIVQPPNGPESPARCWCGERATFKNSADLYGDYRGWGNRPKGARPPLARQSAGC